MIGGKRQDAVSYTHLDVYKRQMGDKGDCQPEHLSRQRAPPQPLQCLIPAGAIHPLICTQGIWGKLCRADAVLQGAAGASVRFLLP